MMMKRTIARWLLAQALATGAACDFVTQFPVITSFPPTWEATTPTKILAATITQNNGELDPRLRVRCEFSFERPAGTLQPPNVRSVPAQRIAGNDYNCTLTLGPSLRNNHVLVFEWLVESVNQQGEATPVARSGVKRFHVGCPIDDPTEFLRLDQAQVVSALGALTTVAQILAAGYVPTHSTFLDQFPVNRVFRGMGVAFARAQDLAATGNFVPSGPPQSGHPNLLLFLPSATVAGRPDLSRPDATYRLIGWAYAANRVTVPGPFPPNTGCFPLHEWFFHEAGVHTLDGGFSLGVSSAPGVPHERLWDLHVWARPNSIPELAILNVTTAGGATTPSAGFVAPVGSFFHPEIPLP
jgi:hypothetical protein